MPPALDVPEIIASVTTATNASPIVVSSSVPHGLKNGEEVKIDGAEGNPAANGAFYVKASSQGATAFELYADEKLAQPVAGTGDYIAGGTIYRPLPEDYAIVVGINWYPQFNRLLGPEADALRFRDWLASPTGGMVALSKIKTILSSDHQGLDENIRATWQPTLQDLKEALRSHSDKAFNNDKNGKGPRVGRRLYMFLSGHGITPDRTPTTNPDYIGALLSASATPSDSADHLMGYPWVEWFRTAGAFDEIILLMDCCRDLKNNVTPTFCTPTPLTSGRREEVRVFYAAAAGVDSKSWETDLGVPPQRHGVFSYVLMEALQNDSLCDANGWLMNSQLRETLKKRVPMLRSDQAPFIDYQPDDFVFIKRIQKPNFQPRKPNLCMTFAPSCTGAEAQLFAGTLDAPKYTHAVNGDPWCLWVEPKKLYKLWIPGSDSKIFQVDGSEEVKNVQFP